jgi:hypothetical protein
VFFSPGGQNIIALFSQGREYLDYLFNSFSGAVNDLRETAANLAVMVHAGKTQIFKRQNPKSLDC